MVIPWQIFATKKPLNQAITNRIPKRVVHLKKKSGTREAEFFAQPAIPVSSEMSALVDRHTDCTVRKPVVVLGTPKCFSMLCNASRDTVTYCWLKKTGQCLTSEKLGKTGA